jgi:hypothetical protein
VDSGGEVLTEPAVIEFDGYMFPSIGVPGGLALETDDGIRLWYPTGGVTDEVIGGDDAAVAASNETHLAYCSIQCTEFEIRDWSSGGTVLVSLPDDLFIDPSGARFSPDASVLAVPFSRGILVIDVEIGLTDPVLDDTVGDWMVAWSPDSKWLIGALYSYGESANSLRRINLSTDEVVDASVPFGGTLSFIVLSPDEAVWFLRDEDQAHTACPPVSGFPSGREGICGFRF